MIKLRNTQTLLLLLAIVVAGVTIWSYKTLGRYQPFADLMNPRRNPMGEMQLQISNAIVTGRDEGKVKWRVKAKAIFVSRDRYTVTADGIHDGFFYDDNERPILQMSARTATYQAPGGFGAEAAFSSLQLNGGIEARVLKAGGPTFRTDSLIWNGQKHLVQAPGQVTAIFPGGVGAASGSEINFDTQTQNLTLRRLHGTFKIGRLVN
ncbi:MAG: LPS export ABC transporter periplasmic protein LptC [Capsulimonas sp.]|uniref:LPS export ABC transporter periplasmic protein LptC n=1 Tax=Capsulimonas sp. TaxID=2494211 RepID=UPI00326652A6